MSIKAYFADISGYAMGTRFHHYFVKDPLSRPLAFGSLELTERSASDERAREGVFTSRFTFHILRESPRRARYMPYGHLEVIKTSYQFNPSDDGMEEIIRPYLQCRRIPDERLHLLACAFDVNRIYYFVCN